MGPSTTKSTTTKEEDQEHIELEEEQRDNNKPSDEVTNEENFHYLQSPIRCSGQDIIIEQEDPFKLNTEKIKKKESKPRKQNKENRGNKLVFVKELKHEWIQTQEALT